MPGAGRRSPPCREVPPQTRGFTRGSPSGSQAPGRGSVGLSAPLTGAGSFPCQPCLGRVLPQPPLAQQAGYSTLIPSAGKGVLILALLSGYPPCFFGSSQNLGEPAGPSQGRESGRELRVDSCGCSAVPSSPSIYLGTHRCSSSLQHPAALSQSRHTSFPLTTGARGIRLFLAEAGVCQVLTASPVS